MSTKHIVIGLAVASALYLGIAYMEGWPPFSAASIVKGGAAGNSVNANIGGVNVGASF